ncbi:hypothetical protein [Xanthomonas translucens]|uniref:hypothetical protein n=3 Tax=Xanthomonas campestris pv. translucens TaxID=343 RepID=UPI003CCD6EDC
MSMSITARWLARAVFTEVYRISSALRRMMPLVASSMALDSAAAFCCSLSDRWIAHWRFHDGADKQPGYFRYRTMPPAAATSAATDAVEHACRNARRCHAL